MTNPAVIHGLCAMAKQQCIARSGSPHDDDIILLVYEYTYHTNATLSDPSLSPSLFLPFSLPLSPFLSLSSLSLPSSLLPPFHLFSPSHRGMFAVVRQCTEKATDRQFAAKLIPFSSPESHDLATWEFEIHRQLAHPRIVGLQDAFESEKQTILVLE